MKARAFLALIISLPLAGAAYADAASGMASGKRQHKPLSAAEQPANETPAMNKAELTESLATPAATGGDKTRGKNRDARKAARERAEEIAAGKAKDDDVAAKTDKSEAARARKKH